MIVKPDSDLQLYNCSYVFKALTARSARDLFSHCHNFHPTRSTEAITSNVLPAHTGPSMSFFRISGASALISLPGWIRMLGSCLGFKFALNKNFMGTYVAHC